MAPTQTKLEDTEEVKKVQFFCRTCHKSFGRRYHLERHLVNTRCSGKPPGCFPCDTCGKIFPTEAKLHSHTRNHGDNLEGAKRFACNQCGRRFWSHSLLRIHARQHTGERPFLCPECPKGFVSLGSLNKHRLCHAKERPHACPYCPARFTLKGTLNRHLPIHTGVRPHKCPHCSKEFVQAVALKSHLFSHTGQDGFRCTVCGRVFSRKTRMEEHIRTVHEKQHPHTCSECGKTFPSRNELLCHSELGHDTVQHFLCEQNDGNDTRTIEVEVKGPGTAETLDLGVPGGCMLSLEHWNDLSTAIDDRCHAQQPADHLSSPAKTVCDLDRTAGARDTRETTMQESTQLSSTRKIQRSVTLTSNLETTVKKQLPLGTGTSDSKSCEGTANRAPSSPVDIKSHKTFEKQVSEIMVKGQIGGKQSNNSAALSAKIRHKDRRQEELSTRIEELLRVLVEKPILAKLGWPEKPVNEVLEAVIRHCGCSPSKYQFSSPSEELRENCKVLFVNVLEDDVAEKLLNNEETVDAVLGKVLELAKL